MKATVVITAREIQNAKAPWQGASLENTISVLAMRKGLRFRATVDPTLNDLIRPFEIRENTPSHGDLTITQGRDEEQTK